MESAKVLVMFGFACEGGRSTFAMRDARPSLSSPRADAPLHFEISIGFDWLRDFRR
jgi:hypothetical protein